MTGGVGNEWALLQKCAAFIADNLSWKIPLTRGPEASLLNDQKFTEYEIRKASVAIQLELDVPGHPEDQTGGAAYLKSLLQFLDDRIDDEILELYPIEGGDFKKLQSIAKLLDDKVTNLDRFLKPIEEDPVEAKERATRFNKFMEHLSALEPVTPVYHQQIRGGSKLEETLKLAGQLQRLSRCLFETLVHNSSCCGGAGSYHVAKLQLLSPNIQYNYDGTILSFNIFLCSRSDREPKTWHEVTFDFKPNLHSDCQLYPHEHSRLCKLIGHCEQRKQGLKIDFVKQGEGNIANISNLQFRRQMFHPALPDVSLASLIDNRGLKEILEGGEFTPGDKGALLLTLAVSLLYLSRESWLRGTLCAEEIYFLRLQNPSVDWIKNIDQPYVSVHLSSNVSAEAETDTLWLTNPCILSFALLMLEIRAGKRISVRSSLWSTINDAVEGEMRAYLTKEFMGAILACLNFELQVHTGIGKTMEAKTREFVFRRIIRPLEEDLKRWMPPIDGRRELKLGHKARDQAPKAPSRRQSMRIPDLPSQPERRSTSTNSDYGSCPDETASDASSGSSTRDEKEEKPHVRFQDEPQRIQSEPSTESVTADELLAAALYDEWDLPSDERTQGLAKTFFEDVSRFNTKFIRCLVMKSSESLPSWQRRPVRVAILDSGLKTTDTFISAALAKHRIVDTKSFIGDSWDDTYGHGTHVARLFLKVAPHAKLYIAKISDAKEIPENQLPAIGKSIEYAINEWDVDIISMSLGLDELEPTIEAALNMALKPDKEKDNKQTEKIVFAAAANGGAGKARAYPADKPGVICVNASDGNGGSIRHLSPAAIAGEDNFVTLGVHVESRWKREDVFKSGTSFATPIAAALAANVLEFARFELEMKHADKCWLYSSKGMRAVLRRFSVEVEGYRFLCPWKKPEGRRLNREYLRDQLQSAFLVDYFK